MGSLKDILMIASKHTSSLGKNLLQGFKAYTAQLTDSKQLGSVYAKFWLMVQDVINDSLACAFLGLMVY